MQLGGVAESTITIQDSTLERFNQLKEELSEQQEAPDHTAETFLNALLDTWEAAENGYYSDPSAEEIAEQLKDEISMANEPMAELDVEELYDEIDRLKELVERVPEDTANKFGEKYR